MPFLYTSSITGVKGAGSFGETNNISMPCENQFPDLLYLQITIAISVFINKLSIVVKGQLTFRLIQHYFPPGRCPRALRKSQQDFFFLVMGATIIATKNSKKSIAPAILYYYVACLRV